MSISVPPPATVRGTGVLVGFDGSAHARLAVYWAADQARRLGGSVVVARAVSVVRTATSPLGRDDRGDAALSTVSAQCRDMFPSVPVETTVVRGGPATALARIARAVGSGCVVIGSGRGDHSATTTALLSMSPVPVVIIRGRSVETTSAPVVAVVEPGSAARVVPYAFTQALVADTPLVVLGDGGRELAGWRRRHPEVVVTTGRPGTSPARLVEGASLYVVGGEAHAPTVIRDAPCPVAVVPLR